MTALPPSPFISNSAGLVMLPADPAVATMTPSLPTAAAGPNSCAGCQNLKFAYEGIDGGVQYRCEVCGEGVYVPLNESGRPWDEYDRDQKLRALYDVLDPPQPPLFLRTGRITDVQPDPSLRHILKVFFAMEA